MDNIPVLGIEEIAFEVKDLDRSIAFYENVIGLPLYSRGPQQAWFRRRWPVYLCARPRWK
jgi:catechol 2,3-dioxygenase-like lactoylglutathione lyase family enzyme